MDILEQVIAISFVSTLTTRIKIETSTVPQMVFCGRDSSRVTAAVDNLSLL